MPGSHSQPSHDDIEICAYCIWVQEGKPEGRDLDHWLQAEMQLLAANSQEEAGPALISSTSELQLAASQRREKGARYET